MCGISSFALCEELCQDIVELKGNKSPVDIAPLLQRIRNTVLTVQFCSNAYPKSSQVRYTFDGLLLLLGLKVVEAHTIADIVQHTWLASHVAFGVGR